jgi:tetratricopeptide (TPR) repeat protein
MSPSNELFDLIKKMSKSEKRYFTLVSKPQKGSKDYLTLFQEVEKMSFYDEAILKDKLALLGFNVAHLAVAKINLTKLLLKSLRGYYEGNSQEHGILSMLLEADILKNKGLYRLAIKHLNKAKETALKYGMHYHTFEILNRLSAFYIFMFDKKADEKLAAIFEEMETLKKITYREAEIRALAYKINIIASSKPLRHPNTIAAIEALVKHPAVQQLEPDDTFFSKIYYFLFHGMVCNCKGEYEKANPHYKKVLEIWNSYPHIRDINTRIYKSHITGYLNSCHTLGNYDVFGEWLEKFETIKDSNFDEEAGSFKDIYHIKLLYLLNTMQLQKALEMAPQIEHGLVVFGDRISKSRETTLRFNVFLVYFIYEKFSEALDWLRTIKLEEKLEAKADPRALGRILNVIVHYELNHNRILDDLRNSVYRKLKKMDQLHEFEKAILDHIRLLEHATDKKSKAKLFKDLLVKLNDVGEKYGFNQVAGLEEVICWAESRFHGISYLEALKRRKQV